MIKLISSVSLSYALFSLLAYSPISSLAAPLTERSDIKQNEEFSVMSLRSGNINVHFHSFYVGDNNNVYLDPYDNGNEAAKFTLADTYLLHEGFSAHLGDNGALYFQRNDEGSILGFDFGERIASGYALELNGQSPVACPIEENSSVYSVFFGKGNGNNKCVGFTALALPNNTSSSSKQTSDAKIEDIAIIGSQKVKKAKDQDVKEADNGPSIFPNAVRFVNSSSPNTNYGKQFSPIVYQNQDTHVNALFNFEIPQIDEKHCQLHFHLDKNSNPIKVDGPNGIGEFKLYNFTSVANILTTWANRPGREAEIGHFNCSSDGCDYTTNITCPYTYTSVTYELSGVTDESYMKYYQETNPIEGLYLTV